MVPFFFFFFFFPFFFLHPFLVNPCTPGTFNRHIYSSPHPPVQHPTSPHTATGCHHGPRGCTSDRCVKKAPPALSPPTSLGVFGVTTSLRFPFLGAAVGCCCLPEDSCAGVMRPRRCPAFVIPASPGFSPSPLFCAAGGRLGGRLPLGLLPPHPPLRFTSAKVTDDSRII